MGFLLSIYKAKNDVHSARRITGGLNRVLLVAVTLIEEVIVPETPVTIDNGQMFIYVTKYMSDSSADKNYVYEQAVASSVWNINHNLKNQPCQFP